LIKNISEKDKKDWQEFISNKDKLYNKDVESKGTKFTITKTIDLHGFTLDEANKNIEKFIFDSYLNNVSKIIVVTGKGLHSKNENDPYISKDLGILKYSVPEYINKNSDLMKMIIDIKEAKIQDGGEGAFYIYLKKNKSIK
jgi:DNA-nicking Smr family endonuclease